MTVLLSLLAGISHKGLSLEYSHWSFIIKLRHCLESITENKMQMHQNPNPNHR